MQGLRKIRGTVVGPQFAVSGSNMRRDGSMPRRFLVMLGAAALLGTTNTVHACPGCATANEVRWQIAQSQPALIIATMVAAFALVAGAIVLVARTMGRAAWLGSGAMLLGAGMGAFLDGILLHQVLQWHAMVSEPYPPTDLITSKLNMFWDGIFHTLSWLTVVASVVILTRELPKYAAAMVGWVVAGGALVGWGLFNVVEGLIDHSVMRLHHVHPGEHETVWDVSFLAFGVLLIAGGLVLSRPKLRQIS